MAGMDKEKAEKYLRPSDFDFDTFGFTAEETSA